MRVTFWKGGLEKRSFRCAVSRGTEAGSSYSARCSSSYMEKKAIIDEMHFPKPEMLWDVRLRD